MRKTIKKIPLFPFLGLLDLPNKGLEEKILIIQSKILNI